MKNKNTIALLILDGWGLRDAKEGNAIFQAKTPNFDDWRINHERSILKASGEAVGLTLDQMGNSEVGHLNIGAGRIVYQDIARIDHEIDDGSFFSNQILNDAFEYVKSNQKQIHMFGLFGPGGVHSHTDHLYALLKLAQEHLVTPIVHIITDGRDTPPNSALNFVKELEQFITVYPAKIASVSGRYYAMDRDKRWDRTKLAFDAYTIGTGLIAPSPHEAVEFSYAQNVSDEFIKPTLIPDQNGYKLTIQDGDCLLFFNFRADRMRQIVKSLVFENFDEFERKKIPVDLNVITFTEYDNNFPVKVVFQKDNVSQPLAEIISSHGLKQFHAAETEKYAHVTFFFNGGREEPFPGEERLLIQSPKVATYDLKPEMSAHELTEAVLNRIEKADDDLIVVNYANLDMVGHTGVLKAGITAAETVDSCAGRLVRAIVENGGTALITADHGNAELMFDKIRNEPHTYHTTNPVQLYVIGQNYYQLRPQGSLQDVAPTILHLMGLEKPKVMTGRSLIEDVG